MTEGDTVQDLVTVTGIVIVTGEGPVPDPHTLVAEGQGLHTTEEDGPGPVPVLHVVTGTTDAVHVLGLDLRMRGGGREGGQERERGRGTGTGNEIETIEGIAADLLGKDLYPAARNEHHLRNPS